MSSRVLKWISYFLVDTLSKPEKSSKNLMKDILSIIPYLVCHQ